MPRRRRARAGGVQPAGGGIVAAAPAGDAAGLRVHRVVPTGVFPVVRHGAAVAAARALDAQLPDALRQCPDAAGGGLFASSACVLAAPRLSCISGLACTCGAKSLLHEDAD